MTLTPIQAKVFYDRFGKKQDAQSFYEDFALSELVAHANLDQAQTIFELGCGTGRFALRLLQKHLTTTAFYYGVDVSNTMVDIANERLAPFAQRSKIMLTDGEMSFAIPDHSVDRVISTYVFDLLSQQQIIRALSEAHRVLTGEGKLCLVSLAHGNTIVSRSISSLWSLVFRLSATLVGGCRPIHLQPFINAKQWVIEYHHVVTQFGVPSEVLIARPI